MKLGVSYNLFDGEELLEDSLLSIIDSVDYVSIVCQKISNFGEKANPSLMDTLLKLKDGGLINDIVIYEPNINKGGHLNEIHKRNMGLILSRQNDCTHHMSMDSDEFYIKEELDYVKDVIIEGDYDGSAFKMITYYKDYSHRIEPKEEYFVSGIFKIKEDSKYDFNNILPVLVDPTRKIKSKNFREFDRNEIEMHHMSYVRDNIFKKLRNSSAKNNFKNVENIVKYFNEWEYPKKAIMAGTPNKVSEVVKVENKFNKT